MALKERLRKTVLPMTRGFISRLGVPVENWGDPPSNDLEHITRMYCSSQLFFSAIISFLVNPPLSVHKVQVGLLGYTAVCGKDGHIIRGSAFPGVHGAGAEPVRIFNEILQKDNGGKNGLSHF